MTSYFGTADADILDGSDNPPPRFSLNSYFGYDGDDILIGSSGEDRFYQGVRRGPGGPFSGLAEYDFGRGNDLIDGGGGIDRIEYGDFKAVSVDLADGSISRGRFVDRFINIEVLYLGRGADYVKGLTNGMEIDGRDGRDRLDLRRLEAGAVVDLALETAEGDGASMRLIGFREVLGATGHANTLQGDGEANLLQGGDRDDSLNGGRGGDILIGGLGDDTITTGGGRDTVRAGAGDDTVIGDGGGDVIFTGAGNDLVKARNAAQIDTGAGDDIVRASGTMGVTRTGDGEDRLTGASQMGGTFYLGAGNDQSRLDQYGTIYGQAGDDTLEGYNLFGGKGEDVLVGVRGGVVHGDAGNDTLSAATVADALHGDAGDDVFYLDRDKVGLASGGIGDDVFYIQDTRGEGRKSVRIEGGPGYDVLHLGNQTVTIDNRDTPHFSANVFGIEAFLFDDGRDHLRVLSGGFELVSLGGADRLYLEADGLIAHGGAGNDRILIGAGEVVAHGDRGNDVFRFYRDSSHAQVFGGEGDDSFDVGGTGHVIDTGVGRDIVNVDSSSSQIDITTGRGQDEIWYNGRDTDTRSSLRTGGEDDRVVLGEWAAEVNLGRGDDLFELQRFLDEPPRQIELTLGSGADRVELDDAFFFDILIRDIDPSEDRITHEVALADWDRIEEVDGAVLMFNQWDLETSAPGQGQYLTLDGVTIADLDLVFLEA